jgi:hypothetical protein
MSEPFHVNFSLSDTLVLEMKNFNGPNPFLHFCDYLPFDEDMILDLNKSKFTLPKDNLHQV